jgi:hypothetical protein
MYKAIVTMRGAEDREYLVAHHSDVFVNIENAWGNWAFIRDVAGRKHYLNRDWIISLSVEEVGVAL